MKLSDIRLSTRITVGMLLLVAASALVWIVSENARLHDSYLMERGADLEASLHVGKSRMAQSIETLRQDVVFLVTTPPISGIVRAKANGGIDPRDNNPYETWEKRLQEIFAAFLRAHPNYYQARYVGVANGGRELIRVERTSGRVEVTPREQLQPKGDRDYFSAGLGLSLGRVHLSEFNLNQEWGKIEEPHRPTLRAVTPVFDANGMVFGMVVLNMDVTPLLASAATGLPPGVEAYIADEQGRYLLHPDAQRAFAFEVGSSPGISDDFPSLAPMFGVRTPDYLPLHAANSAAGEQFLAAERLFFDASKPSRFLVLAYRLPPAVVAVQSSRILWPRIAYALLTMLLVGAVLMFMLRRTFSPLARITADARAIAEGDRELRLSGAGGGGGEIGELTEALNIMLDKLAVCALTEKENEFRKSITATTRDGYWLVDERGYLLEANQSYADMTGYGKDELVGMHISRLEAKESSAAEVMAHVAVLIAQGGEVFETQHLRKDGSVFDVEVSTTFLPITHQFVAFCRDISERKKSQAVLERHHHVLETAMDGYWMTSVDGFLEEVNQAYADLVGYTMQELVGMHISQLEASERPEDVRAHIEKIIAQGRDRFETRHRCKDGSLLDLEISVTFDAPNHKFFVFCHDITWRKQASMELLRNQLLLNEAEQLGKFGSWELNLVNNELRWSDEVYRIFEFDPEQVSPSYERFLKVIHPEDRAKVDDAYSRSLQNRQSYSIEHRLLFPDGRIKWLREHCTSAYDDSGKPQRSVGMVQDITEQKRIEDEVRVAAAAFETQDAIVITDAQSNILRVNHAFTAITGYEAGEVIGLNPRIMSSGRHDKAFYTAMWQQIMEQGHWAGEIWDKRKNGEIYPKWMTITAVKNELGETVQYVAIFSDITERKQAEEEIRNLAFYDALTQLPNRRLFMERFQTALLASGRHGDVGSILFLDLDRFKTLNDTLGHDYGDLLLVEVAKRIRSCVREIDTVARLGGDEFVVLLEDLGHGREDASHKAGMVAEKIRESLSQPYQLREHEHYSSPSIGISLFHGMEEPMEVLIKHADAAMYQAKNAGRNAVRFYDPGLQQDLESRAELENDLRRAIDNRELQLYYQVQVDREHRPVGVEALIRWPHPQRGMVSPARFIPVAEESSLILEIGSWVMETACAQLAEWKGDARMNGMTMAVNVSAHQFRIPGFVEQIAALLKRHRLEPSRLKLELTESVVLGDLGEVVTKMQALKALGVQLSLDDFGTGYSSLSYLRRLPLDQIKIDQSFVRDIADDLESAMMVLSIIDMARNFHLDVIAEGVENEAQLAFLAQQDCQAYQGYLFGRPVPVRELAAVLDRLEKDTGYSLLDP
ncbi:MAG: EAL domain-containing protein [Pseudomonadota bacterium]